MLNLNITSIEDIILSEVSLAAVLGVDRKKLPYLRKERDLPCVHITRTTRIYLATEVYEWLEKLARV